jgi:hypothetical protein
LHELNNNLERYLRDKGWDTIGDGWWTPPLGPKGHYKGKCYHFAEAVAREAELRGSTVAELINDHQAEWEGDERVR